MLYGLLGHCMYVWGKGQRLEIFILQCYFFVLILSFESHSIIIQLPWKEYDKGSQGLNQKCTSFV